MGSKDIKYRVGFSIIPSFGRVKLGRLESHFGNLKDAWQAARDDLKHADLDNGTIRATVSWRPKISLEAENGGDYTALWYRALLLKQLNAEPTHIDEVCRSGGMPVSTVSGTLTVMELKGLVKQVGNMNYVLTQEAREEYGVKVD